MSLNHWLALALFCAAASFMLALWSLRRDRLPWWQRRRVREIEEAMQFHADQARAEYARRKATEYLRETREDGLTGEGEGDA